MAALKWALVALFSFASVGALAMGFTGAKPAPYSPTPLREVSLREFPGARVMAAAPAEKKPEVIAEAPKPVEPVKIAEAPTPAEPVKVAEAPKPAEPVKVAEAPKPAEPVKVAEAPKPPAPAPVAKPAEAPKPAPAPIAKPAEAAKPVVVAAAPKPAATPPPAAPKAEAAEGEDAAPPEGILNLRASDTAEIYVDGKKVGGSPVTGLKVAPGKHKVRFDCYDASGGTVQGTPQTVSVPADGEKDFEFECPAQ